MVAFRSSSMSGENLIRAKTLLLMMYWMHSVILFNGVAAIPHEEELDDMVSALRIRGYNRFRKDTETSDLRFDLLNLENLTLFAPTDDYLFTLHMEIPADLYISAIRRAVLRRLSVSDLIVLHPSTILTTLLHNHAVSITISGKRAVGIAVNGLPLEAPGLYYSSHVVVHGLAGALSSLSGMESVLELAPKAGSNQFTSWLPSSDGDLPHQAAGVPPIETSSSVNGSFSVSQGPSNGQVLYWFVNDSSAS